MSAFAQLARMPVFIPLAVIGLMLAAPSASFADSVTVTSQELSENGAVVTPAGNKAVTSDDFTSSDTAPSLDTGLQSATFAGGSGSHQGTITSTITSALTDVTAIDASVDASTAINFSSIANDPSANESVTYSLVFQISVPTTFSLSTLSSVLTNIHTGAGVNDVLTTTVSFTDDTTSTPLLFSTSTGPNQLSGTLDVGTYTLLIETDLDSSIPAGASGIANASASVSYDLTFGDQPTTVPEPASFLMAGIGGLGLLGFRRRKPSLCRDDPHGICS